MDINFSEIVDRMRSITNTTYDSELARVLGISPQALSNFKKKGKLPSDLAIRFALEHKVSVDWLLTGEWDEKSALVVLRQRLQRATARRPIEGLVLDTDMTAADLRKFIQGTCTPDKSMLLLLSQRAGGVCREEGFLKAIAGRDRETEKVKGTQLGRRVQDYREVLRLKPREFAEMVGISPEELKGIETQTTTPSEEAIEAIINRSDVNPTWLKSGEGYIRKADNRTGDGRLFLVGLEVDADLMWQVLGTLHSAMSAVGLDPVSFSEKKRITIRDLIYADAVKQGGPDDSFARVLCRLAYCEICGEKGSKQRWEKKWGVKLTPGQKLEEVTIFVKAAPGTTCPMEDMPGIPIPDNSPVEVRCTEYYRRLVDDGSLVIVSKPDPEE